jgi:16S rRNA (uracil1498-N3)-methyltransferase
MTTSLQRLFVANYLKENEEIALNSAQTHYLVHVLRHSAGSPILVFNGMHGEWIARITEIKRGNCLIRLTEKVREQSIPQDLHYLFAPLKQARLDYTIQKAVEMGVSLLQPVITAHTVVQRINAERMHANAVEAAEQCGILSIPEIKPAVKLQSLLKTYEDERTIIFCDESSLSGSPVRELEKLKGRKIAVLVGPEGGFSEDERGILRSKSFVHAISLGPRILRADTAALAALALVNAVLGDWR